MNPESLLTQLRDAHAPEPFGLWPLAPGWWIVLVLGLILLTALVYFYIRHWRSNLWRRQANAEFKSLRKQYLEKPSKAHLITLNQLLKRTLCSVRGTRNYMQYVEQDWASELSSVQIKGAPILQADEIELLSHAIYCPDERQLDEAALKRLEQWIRKVS